ncbi:hypothetical protein [Actinomadura flavalba]|uniref:hypothetical protein n=1 Tax=Actinomadura flavalba TaxID=1120938 RepID=UPI00037C7C0C|nr:hypothetical protein [Actinomadura flavalba]
MRTRPRSPDAGASAIHYAALLLVGAIVLTFLAMIIPSRVVDDVRYEICRIFNGGDASKCERAADVALKPPCTSKVSSDSYGGTVDVAIFRVGRDYGFMRTTTIGPDGKKTVTVTAVKGLTGGVGTGVGIGVNWKAVNAGADASADAKLRIGVGDGWTFDGPDAEQKADAFMKQIRKQYAIDGVKENGGIIGRIGGEVYDAVAGPDIPSSDIRRWEGELDLSGSLSAGLGLGPADPKGKHRKPDRHTSPEGPDEKSWKDKVPDGRGSDAVSPNAKAYVGVNGNEKAVFEENKKTGDLSVTFILKGEANYGANALVSGPQGRRNATGALTVTRDKNGKLSKVTFAQTHIVDGTATVVTTELPLTTDQERADVMSYLINPVQSGGPGLQTLALTWDDMAPQQDPGPNASPLQRLLYEKGKSSKVNYAYDQTDDNYGASVKLGLKLGGNLAISNSTRQVSDAQYLGAPGTDGKRRYLTHRECR